MASSSQQKGLRRGMALAFALAAVVLLWGCSKQGHGPPHPSGPVPVPSQTPTPDHAPP